MKNLALIYCRDCNLTGRRKGGFCRTCKGMAVGVLRRDKFLYWGYPLTVYNFVLEKARVISNRIRFFTAIIIGLNFWIWAGILMAKLKIWQLFLSGLSGPLLFVQAINKQIAGLIWLGILFFIYAWYRSALERSVDAEVEHFDYNNVLGDFDASASNDSVSDWVEIVKLPHRKKLNIANTFTKEARLAIGQAYMLADRSDHKAVTLLHLFYSLISFSRVSNVFVRLGHSPASLKTSLESMFVKHAKQNAALSPTISEDVWQVLFSAYDRAYEGHERYVSIIELFEACVLASAPLQEFLDNINIDRQKLINVVAWARVRERLQREAEKLRAHGRLRSKHGMDRAMTAVATPYLDRFSEDLTRLAQLGYLETCVARDTEIEEIFRVVEGGVQSVLLVGENGVGKKSIIEGIARRMVAEDVPDRLADKRLVRLSTSALLSGVSPAQAIERLIMVMNEASRARNIILFIHNIHEIIGVAVGGEGGQTMDVASTLNEFISGGAFMTFATTTAENYAKVVRGSVLSNSFSKVDIKEMDENQTIQVLESKVGYLEYKQQVFFSYVAIEKAAQLAKRYLHDLTLPGAALEILTESASFARSHKGLHSLVLADEVAKVVAQKTKIPVDSITQTETKKLLNLEAALHARVIGQDEAVTMVANALRRARAEVRAQTRPIANFLFMGPTGVGKTELAKAIAEVYFGGENKMIRLDMSEYQDTGSVYRLIGAPNQKGTGVLTEAIRQNPFTLLLLDEIEKADKEILNLFLQVMDDGRLTDSTGRIVDLTNIILIATSNAGTSYVAEQMRAGVGTDAIKDQLLHGKLSEYFRPEFLNRFDGIVLFKPLDTDSIKQVAMLMLKRVGDELAVKGIHLEVDQAALDYLASIGFDQEFGARPMRRVIEDKVENKLAEMLLSGTINRHDTVILDKDGNLVKK